MLKFINRVKETARHCKEILQGPWETEFKALQEKYMAKTGKKVDVVKEFGLSKDRFKVKGKPVSVSLDVERIDEVTTGLRFGGISARFKIVKGVYARFGDFDGKQKKTTMVVDQGKLHIYPGGIYFDGDQDNKLITDTEISSVTYLPKEQGAIRIEKWKGKPITFLLKLSPKQALGMICLSNSYPK